MPRIFAIDYGTERVGTAVSDETATLARPVATVEVRGPKQIARDLAEMVEQHGAEEIVLGLPLTLQGEPGEHAASVEDLARRLRGRLHRPVHLVDERFTTVMAERSLIESGKRRAERKRMVDGAAAAVLLQSFLDGRKMQEAVKKREAAMQRRSAAARSADAAALRSDEAEAADVPGPQAASGGGREDAETAGAQAEGGDARA